MYVIVMYEFTDKLDTSRMDSHPVHVYTRICGGGGE